MQVWLSNRSRPLFRTDFPAIKNWDTLRITLDRSLCLGTCPDYTVEISGDGTMRYTGRQFVAVFGRHQSHISHDAVISLFREFETVDFFSTLDGYYAGGTDGPTYAVTISFDGHSKKVRDYRGAAGNMPWGITNLEHAIDAAANTQLWVKGTGDVFAALQAEGWDLHAASNENSEMIEAAEKRGDTKLVNKLTRAETNAAVIDQSQFLTPKAQ